MQRKCSSADCSSASSTKFTSTNKPQRNYFARQQPTKLHFYSNTHFSNVQMLSFRAQTARKALVFLELSSVSVEFFVSYVNCGANHRCGRARLFKLKGGLAHCFCVLRETFLCFLDVCADGEMLGSFLMNLLCLLLCCLWIKILMNWNFTAELLFLTI